LERAKALTSQRTPKLPMNRRLFLKGSALTAAGLALSRSHIFASASVAPKKIIIIGAGMAGLSAGYELTQLGHDVTILEARARPGGRVHTLREPFADGLYAEAGAARIPDTHELTLKYVKLFELPLEPMYPSELSALVAEGATMKRVPIDGFTKAMGNILGAELGTAAARWSKIKGGNDLLPQAFAARLRDKIHYESPVIKIDQDERSVTVSFLQKATLQTMTADRILCTVPFSVLRDVTFPAKFPEKKIKAIREQKYDAVARVYLQTKKRAWEAAGLSGFALTNEPVEIWHPTWSQPGSRGIVMTYARPGVAEKITAMKEPERIAAAVKQIDSLLPGVRENFESGTSKCWMEDEWSRGAWAFAGINGLLLFGTPEGRIHFAGEHLSFLPSWMQGALASSAAAVKAIHEAPEERATANHPSTPALLQTEFAHRTL
jgi:monoamine oxidase